MFPSITIPSLHHEYRTWIAELNFCKEEISFFEARLAALLKRTDDKEASVQAERFQNQFIWQKEVIDELKHYLNAGEKQRIGMVKELSGLGLESIRLDNHPDLREEITVFRELYKELKKAFRSFEAEHR